MLVASFEMPERGGISSTSTPVSSSTRTTFAHSGSDRADSRSKSRVYSRSVRARSAHRCTGDAVDSRLSAGSRPATIPFAPPTIGRYSGSSRSVPSTTARSELSSASISPAPKRPLQRASISSKSVGQIASAFRPFDVGRTTQVLFSPRALPKPSRFAEDPLPTATYRHRSMPPNVESIRDFGSPAAPGSSPTVIPSPTNRRKFDHITSETTRARPPACANRCSNSLSSSIVYAISACESRVDSGVSDDDSTCLDCR